MTPHYPTSAELAAFRRARFFIGPDGMGTNPGSVWGWVNPATGRPTMPFGLDHPRDGGAWPHERERGIGHTCPPPMIANDDDELWCEGLRRKANRLRHSQYAYDTGWDRP